LHQSVTFENNQRAFNFANEYHVENLEGRFHELESTNDVEAQHIIRLLNQVKQTPQRVFPSVGIVAFTKEQREDSKSYSLWGRGKSKNDASGRNSAFFCDKSAAAVAAVPL